MDPILFDVWAYSAVARSRVKTQSPDAVDAEVPSQYSLGRARYISTCLSYDSEVIQSSRYILTAKRLFGDVVVRLLVRVCTYWRKCKSNNMHCNTAAQSDATIEPIGEVLWGLIGLSGFDPKRKLKPCIEEGK
ncbi:hypothetical protein OAD57_04860 [Porticoccaceae bacterium]|nr:hypothetical protein [Porticoccaceae bacterium]